MPYQNSGGYSPPFKSLAYTPYAGSPQPSQGGGGFDLAALLSGLQKTMAWPAAFAIPMDPILDPNLFGVGDQQPGSPGGQGGGLLDRIQEMLARQSASSKPPTNATVAEYNLGAGMPDISGGGQQQQPGMNADQEALAQLYQLITSAGGGPQESDLQAALEQSAAGIKQQYGAQIGAIRDANQGARQDTNRGSAKVQALYKALAKSYKRAGKQEKNQGAQLANQLANMGENAQDAAAQQAAKLNESSAAAAAGLGLADLGQALVKQNNAEAQRQGNIAGQRGQLASTQALETAGNNRTYMNTGATSSRLEGTNRSADMYAQLQDYLQQNRSEISSIAGQREQALAAANAAITGDFAGQQADSQQQMVENLMAMFGLAHNAQNDQFDQQMQLQELLGGGGSGQEDPYAMLPDQVAGPAKLLSGYGNATVADLYGNLSGSNEMGTGYFNAGGNTNDRQSLQGNFANVSRYVQQMIGPEQWNQLSEGDRTTLISALLLQLQGMSTTQAQP